MDSRLVALGGCLLTLVAATGCTPEGGSEPGEGPLASARQGQIMLAPEAEWRLYDFTFANEEPFVRILVIGPDEVRPYAANTEYWFVNQDGLQYLGEEDLEASYDEGDGTPPSLSGDQAFTQPVYLTWSSFSTDPVTTGELYDWGDAHLRVKYESGAITRLTWYQVISSHDSPANLTPDGTFTPGTGSVSVPYGYDGYYIDATID